MSALKVEWVQPAFLLDDTARAQYSLKGRNGMIPVVRLEAVRAWLEAHQYPRQYGATAHNGVIDDLLAELKDLA